MISEIGNGIKKTDYAKARDAFLIIKNLYEFPLETNHEFEPLITV